ncbi:deoxycytidylate deaminase-like [Pollicipes pollicipes]|uniref:deoxycytidylate deaminase-like n=1 Tax=Pollicipes pollicipes TaxID=41117 RepID=UPI0018852B28|nr:deoxycytidylate deaminase-like [Pollicipes pollicipes]XP_037088115.1 deoxycytidylate deaminase-like [Pollicipes pollicipes]
MNANVNENASAVQDAPDCLEGAGSGRDASLKRTGYLEWAEYFMAICFLSAMRSKDPVTQVGACIVSDDRKIVGIGYNGMPLGCSDDRLPWGKVAANSLDTKYMYVCHAEMNAIMNKNSANVKGCTIYVALFPCNECAKLIIQSGIRKVVYASDKHSHKSSTIASKRLLEMAGVECCQYVPPRRQVVIDFDVINLSSLTQLPDSPPRPTAQPEAAQLAESAQLVETARRDLAELLLERGQTSLH